jgi:hypothetical protein
MPFYVSSQQIRGLFNVYGLGRGGLKEQSDAKSPSLLFVRSPWLSKAFLLARHINHHLLQRRSLLMGPIRGPRCPLACALLP